MAGPRASNGSRYDLGGPAGAPAVVLIHGLGLNRRVWRDYLPRLRQRYRVLDYDLFGHGESARPPAKPSLSLFAGQLLELMDELEIGRAALIGFSLGGMINRRVAMDRPDRVSGLVILNSPHEREPDAQRSVERRALDSAAGGPGATLEAAIERWFTPEFRRGHAAYIDEVRAWVLANEPAVYAECREVLAFGVTELIQPEPPITLPTLVVTCEFDSGSTPAMSQAIASEIAGASVVVVPGLRHMGLVENPSFFIGEIADFLESIG